MIEKKENFPFNTRRIDLLIIIPFPSRDLLFPFIFSSRRKRISRNYLDFISRFLEFSWPIVNEPIRENHHRCSFSNRSPMKHIKQLVGAKIGPRVNFACPVTRTESRRILGSRSWLRKRGVVSSSSSRFASRLRFPKPVNGTPTRQ